MIEQAATQHILEKLSQCEILHGIIDFCKENEFSLAAWRLPESSQLQVIIDNTKNNLLEEGPIEELKEGFIFAPFDKSKTKYYLRSVVKINLNSRLVDQASNGQLLNQLQDYLEQCIKKKQSSAGRLTYSEQSQSSNDYEQLVSKSIDAIKDGLFLKVVPSRYKEVQLSTDFNAASHFINLESQYKKSFVSIVYTPETNIWIGATPELLIHTAGSIFKTVALAGTQQHNPDISPSDIAWTQKEIEEQAFVSRYIINCFKRIRLREFDEIGPKTIVAGNLIHLKTEFSVDMEATNFPQLGTTMLELLHPTSAICGMPLESAYEFLMAHEGYDRKFFSGYLGPVNDASGTSLFVNLRCMEIKKNQAILYAGAGVTESSNPHKEWLETEMKMNTLLNVIKN